MSTLSVVSILASIQIIPQMKIEAESVLVKTELKMEEENDKEVELQRRMEQRQRSVNFTPRLKLLSVDVMSFLMRLLLAV